MFDLMKLGAEMPQPDADSLSGVFRDFCVDVAAPPDQRVVALAVRVVLEATRDPGMAKALETSVQGLAASSTRLWRSLRTALLHLHERHATEGSASIAAFLTALVIEVDGRRLDDEVVQPR